MTQKKSNWWKDLQLKLKNMKTRKDFEAWITKNKIKVNLTANESTFLDFLIANQSKLTLKGDITGVYALFSSFLKG